MKRGGICAEWDVRKHPPLREGGAARWQERREYCALGVNGKGGGGSTAVCCRCMLAHDRLAKGLIRLLLERG